MERRRHPRKPIRLKVRYRSAHSLVTEYTTCISKGGCVVLTSQALAIGTRFVFEMYAADHDEPLEVDGEVVRVQEVEVDPPQFEIAIQYMTIGPQRDVLDALLSRIMVDPSYESVRRHPRIPVNLIAHDDDRGARYLIRDISRGGMRLESRTISGGVGIGRPVTVAALVSQRRPPILITGKVVWVHRGSRLVRTRLGIQFDPLDRAPMKPPPGFVSAIALVDGLARLLRPHRLELAFAYDPKDAERPSQRRRLSRATFGANEICELIRPIAVQCLRRLPELELAAIEPTQRPTDPSAGVARVGLVGDVDGEIILEPSAGLAWQVASRMVDEPMLARDDSVIADAITELATTLAGAICDALENSNVEMDVAAPIPGELKIAPEDSVITVQLGGPFGSVVLTILTRDVQASQWPI